MSVMFRIFSGPVLTSSNMNQKLILQYYQDTFLSSEIEFLDNNLTKDSSRLLHAIHSLSTGG
jgi:hypothetical protein